MFNAHCYVCSDKTHYATAVSNAKRINIFLSRRLSVFDSDKSNNLSEKEKSLLNKVRFDGQNVHFMCGECHKINKMELINAEKELKLSFIKVVRVLLDDKNDESKSKSLKMEVFNSLRGYYPSMARVLRDGLYNR